MNWLVTGAGGFIGSHLIERLLSEGYKVRGVDLSFHRLMKERPDLYKHKNFSAVGGNLCNWTVCDAAVEGIDVVAHLAAYSSVPLSMKRPAEVIFNNVTSFNNMIDAALREKIKKFIYASSSAVYGDDTSAVKIEESVGKPLSPYAASKRMNEIVAETYGSLGLPTVGLRFFNIFGPRQAGGTAVIPKWISAFLKLEAAVMYGNGTATRDFCYVSNAVDAIIAAASADSDSVNKVYNIGMGTDTTLGDLSLKIIKEFYDQMLPTPREYMRYEDWRSGEIPCSCADISRAKAFLNYSPKVSVQEGLKRTVEWYAQDRKADVV